MLAKPSRHRDKKFIWFVQGKPCCICMAPPPSEANHLDSSGVGTKGSDLFTVPMCHSCHTLYHSLGTESFLAKEHVEPNWLWKVSARQLAEYFTEGE